MNFNLKAFYAGTFEHSFDEKGRITVPSEWREEGFEKQLIVSKSDEGCLKVHPMSWLAEKMQSLSQTHIQDPRRKQLEIFASEAQTVSFDSQGRVTIKPQLRSASGLSKSVVLVGRADHVEIWDRKKWNSNQQGSASFEQAFGGGQV